MVSFVQSVIPVPHRFRKCAGVLAAGLALLTGGCSADIARFDFASLNDKGAETGAIPVPEEPVRQRSNLIGQEAVGSRADGQGTETAGGNDYPRRSGAAQGVNVESLEPPAGHQPRAQASAEPGTEYGEQRSAVVAALPESEALRNGSAKAAPAHIAPVMAEHAEVSRGEEIEVQPGDTLYGLSRRHRVSLNDLMAVNDLKGPNLKPGQKLYIPSVRTVERPVERAAPAVALQAPADWTGAYTVKPGDSLYSIATRYKLKAAEIQRYNGIEDVRRVKPGMVLRLPAGAGDGTAVADAASGANGRGGAPASSIARAQQEESAGTAANRMSGAAAPFILNGEKRVAAVEQAGAANDAAASGGAGSGSVAAIQKLRWPVEGRIISGFGKRVDGTSNDGVNLAVPLGTDIHAAELGTVAYAGDELKGYGNLVLIRHDNGWVTAYAHADEVLVERGETVKRGQVIARAGKSGNVDQPQVHFELRLGQKPVDPGPYMEKM
jgi:murein DD-endopeptidase MepM/ murein hydrolase activator NlpD